jgi:hypothetical protein
MSARDFLTSLWGDPPPGQVLVWTLPRKRSTWFQHFSNLDTWVDAHKDEDIYTGVGIVANDAKVTAATRTSNTNVSGLAGLWADLDIQHGVHKKGQLPPSVEAVLEALKEFEHPPSYIIHSGHGLHLWWLFQAPWVFSAPTDRAKGAALAQWWHSALGRLFLRHNWALDATHDLARVLRLPGTINYKATPTPVEIIGQSPTRLDVAALLTQVPLQAYQVAQPASVNGSAPLLLNHDAAPPAGKFAALLANSPQFAASWRHERRFKDNDASASVYDMSLASLAAQAQWSDQEIADLLVAHRRQWGQDLKLREDYYQRTIYKATAKRDAAVTHLSELDGETDREAILDSVSNLIGIRIDQILRYDGTPVTFGARLGSRVVHLGEADGINSQRKFRDKVAGATLVNLRPVDKAEWDVVAQKLLDACETIDLGEETRPVEEMAGYVMDYLVEHPPYAEITEDVLQQRKPIIHVRQDSEVVSAIHLPHFVAWLRVHLTRRATRPEICIWLRDMGAYPEQLWFGNWGRYAVWLLPPMTRVGEIAPSSAPQEAIP